jgi:phosphatidylserine/phosphatidylglycerophosphate/cardiolipin synthase-like enzyme
MFIESILNAAQRGISIFILFDDYGSKEVSPEDINRLTAENIYFAHYNPFRWSHLYKSMRRNHRKLLLVDGNLAFVGGACLSDDYLLKESNPMRWHDVVIKIQGEVVQDWYSSFKHIWDAVCQQRLPEIKSYSYDSYHQHGRIVLAQGPGRNQIIRSAINNINKSKYNIWMATPYFLTTRKLRHALIKAKKRDVDVRLLLPGVISDHPWVSQAARRYYAKLLRNGIRIFEYQPRFIHAKLIICDNWVSVGSSNLDRWNQFWNLDANQIVRDSHITRQATDMFESDFNVSTEITYKQWHVRPVPQRLTEWWSSYIVRMIQWLVFFSTRIKNKSK